MGKRQPTAHELLRLDAIAKYLKIKSRYAAEGFTEAVIGACLERIAPVVDKLLPCSGEQIAQGLGKHLQLTFEEVRSPADIRDLLTRYLKGKKEIGFAQVPDELAQPGVDALLFQLMHAQEQDPDRWVAVLNLQDSDARAYYSRHHELAHRIAEPPQGILPFKRHQIEASSPVEALMDAIAAEFGYYEPAFRPLVEQCARRGRLTFGVVDQLQRKFAPTASLLATMKAIVKYWPQPAAVLVAEYRGRVGAPHVDHALRVTPQGYNTAASGSGLKFIPNMRVPLGSPMDVVYQTGAEHNECERLGDWNTSDGTHLASLDVHTSARRIGKRVYALISLGAAEAPAAARKRAKVAH
jgi:hypothetical protein